MNVNSEYFCKETQHKHRLCNFSHAFYLQRYTIMSFDLYIKQDNFLAILNMTG